MKYKCLFNVVLFLLLMTSCAADSISSIADMTTSEAKELKSLALIVDGTKYYGVIDENLKEVRIGGIHYSSRITGVEWELTAGVSMNNPDLKALIGNEWDKEETFSLTLPSGSAEAKVDYKLILNDFKGYTKKEYMTVGYLPVSLYNHKRGLKWGSLTHVIITPLYITEYGEFNENKINYSPVGLDNIVADAHSNGVKILLSVMGDLKDNNSFYAALETPEMRSSLVKRLWEYCADHNLDGLDIDYEVKGQSGSASNQRLLPFMQELYEKKGDLLLMSAVWTRGWETLYTKEWHKYVDYINLMAYGLSEWQNGVIQPGQHSSFEAAQQSIDFWVKLEAPREKLVLGVPFYGFSWDNIAGTEPGPNPFISYGNIMKAYPDMKDVDNFGRTWYNGRKMIGRKCQLAKDEGTAGIMIWDLYYDDDRPEFSLLDVIAGEWEKD